MILIFSCRNHWSYSSVDEMLPFFRTRSREPPRLSLSLFLSPSLGTRIRTCSGVSLWYGGIRVGTVPWFFGGPVLQSFLLSGVSTGLQFSLFQSHLFIISRQLNWCHTQQTFFCVILLLIHCSLIAILESFLNLRFSEKSPHINKWSK